MSEAPQKPTPNFTEKDAATAQEIMERFWHDLDDESDRGMVLSAVAYFDTLLERCLSSYFVNCKESKSLLKSLGEAGSFSSKLKLCFALRIIDKKQFQTLKLMGTLRNEFAHDVLASLNDRKFSDKIAEIHRVFWRDMPDIQPNKPATRGDFTLTAFCLSDELWLRPLDVSIHTQMYAPLIPYHLDEILAE